MRGRGQITLVDQTKAEQSRERGEESCSRVHFRAKTIVKTLSVIGYRDSVSETTSCSPHRICFRNNQLLLSSSEVRQFT